MLQVGYLARLSESEISSSFVRYVSVRSNGLGIFLEPDRGLSSTLVSLFLRSVNELMLSIMIPCENISLTFSPVGPRMLSRLCLRPKTTRAF